MAYVWSLTIKLFSVISGHSLGGSLTTLRRCRWRILQTQPAGIPVKCIKVVFKKRLFGHRSKLYKPQVIFTKKKRTNELGFTLVSIFTLRVYLGREEGPYDTSLISPCK